MPVSVSHAKSVTIADDTNTDIVRPVDWNSAHAITFAPDGTEIIKWVSAGTQSQSSGTLVFANSNGLTFGMSGNSQITASYTVPNVPSQTNQTLGLYGVGNTTENSSTVLDARTLSLAGRGAMTVGYSNGTIELSAPVQSVQTQNMVSVLGSTGNISFANGNGVTFGANASTVTASVAAQTVESQSAGISNLGNTAGTSGIASGGQVRLLLAGGNNVTLSQSVNGASATITISGPNTAAQSVQTQNVVVPSAGTQTATSGTVVFANSNGVTFGMSGSSQITASVPAQSVQTQSNVQGISAGTQVGRTGDIVFANSNGVTFGMSGSSQVTASYTVPTQSNQTMNLYAVGNTTGQSSSSNFDARTISFQGAGIASVGYSNGSVVVSVPIGGGAGDGVVSFGMSNVGNTAGTSGTVSSGQAVLVGTGPISLSQSVNGQSLTLSINAPATSSISVTGNLQLSTNGNTISLGVPNLAPNRYYIEVMNGERLTSCAALSATVLSNRPIVMPFWMDGTGIVLKTLRFLVSGVGSSNRSFGGTFRAGIYSLANSTQLTLLASDSQSISITASAQSTDWNGLRVMDFTGMSNVTLTAEGRHAVVFQVSPVSANATWMSAQLWGGDVLPTLSGFIVGNTTSASNATSNVFPFWGVYSTTTGGLPSSIALTQVNGGNSASLVDAYAILKEI